MAEPWVQKEDGPPCWCGWPTWVEVHEGVAALICLGHTPEAGASWKLPDERPEDWPDWFYKQITMGPGDREHIEGFLSLNPSTLTPPLSTYASWEILKAYAESKQTD